MIIIAYRTQSSDKNLIEVEIIDNYIKIMIYSNNKFPVNSISFTIDDWKKIKELLEEML